MAQNARKLLRHPSNARNEPHNGGLFMIVEKESIFYNRSKSDNNSDKPIIDLLSQWKNVICSIGFECIKYQLVTSSAPNKQKFHVFVFKAMNPTDCKVDNRLTFSSIGLQIRQDFVHVKSEENEAVAPLADERLNEPAPVNIIPDNSIMPVLNANERIHSDAVVDSPEIDVTANYLWNESNNVIKQFVLCKPEFKHMYEKYIMESKRSFSVGIIGGGISGLTLGNCLSKRNIPYTIYEKDEHVGVRKQGYGLTIQQANSVLMKLHLYSLITSKEVGVTSTSHASYSHDGKLLGAYGVHVATYDNDGNLVLRPEFSNSALHSSDSDSDSDSDVDNINMDEQNNNPKRRKLVHTNNNSNIINKTQESVQKLERQNVHLARQSLRNILLKQLKETDVKWKKRLENMSAVDNGINISFDDGSNAHHSVVVACDGIYSNVRSVLENSIPADDVASRKMYSLNNNRMNYLGVMVILGIAPYFDTIGGHQLSGNIDNTVDTSILRNQHQWLDSSSDCKNGITNTRIFTMPYDQHSTMWQMSFKISEEQANKLSSVGTVSADTGVVLKQFALNIVSGWHAPVIKLISSTPGDLFSGYPIYDRDPIDIKDVDRNANSRSASHPILSRVLLIGDAAHPMSPFKGQGANQAIIDAFKLSDVLNSIAVQPSLNSADGISAQLRHFEQEMYTRSYAKVMKSRTASSYLHSPAGLNVGNISRAAAAAQYCK